MGKKIMSWSSFINYLNHWVNSSFLNLIFQKLLIFVGTEELWSARRGPCLQNLQSELICKGCLGRQGPLRALQNKEQVFSSLGVTSFWRTRKAPQIYFINIFRAIYCVKKQPATRKECKYCPVCMENKKKLTIILLLHAWLVWTPNTWKRKRKLWHNLFSFQVHAR